MPVLRFLSVSVAMNAILLICCAYLLLVQYSELMCNCFLVTYKWKSAFVPIIQISIVLPLCNFLKTTDLLHGELYCSSSMLTIAVDMFAAYLTKRNQSSGNFLLLSWITT